MKVLIAVDVAEDETNRITITCENCGVEIADTHEGPAIINIKGNIPQAAFEAFKRQWLKAVESGSLRPMIVNAEDVQLIQPEPSLRALVVSHAKSCKKSG